MPDTVLGRPLPWPIGELLVQSQSLTRLKAAAPAEDGARRDEQSRGHLFHRITVMEPQQRLRSVQLSGVMGGMGHLHEIRISSPE